MDRKHFSPPWSLVEEDRLRRMIADGKSIEDISKIMKRTSLAIRKRASQLKVPLRMVVTKPRP